MKPSALALALSTLAALSLGAANEVGALSSTRTRAPLDGPTDLTVATYNVNFGVAGDASTLDAMGATDADVLLLQETNERWEIAIRQRFYRSFPHMRFGHPERMPAGGLAVLSRYPFEVTDRSPSDGGFFFAWRVVVHTPSGPVQMLNVHLRPQVTDDGSFLRGRFTTGPLRLRELTAHARTLTNDAPTLVAGDFNESEDGAAVRSMLARGMRSALREFAPRDTTWRWPLGPITLRQRFDHVLYQSSAFECVHARAMHAGQSDHVPVVVRLRRRSDS
jgi:endonuclease/exonuclease/phosphatase (EEP) superfamily protein YafD